MKQPLHIEIFKMHRLHEMVLQILFSLEMGEAAEADLIPFLMRELKMSKKWVRLAYQKALAVFEKRSMLDPLIEEISESYAWKRIGRVEQNVLRLSLYELIHETHIPHAKIFVEALRLTRKFSTKEAMAFVNAILDQYERTSLSSQSERTSA